MIWIAILALSAIAQDPVPPETGTQDASVTDTPHMTADVPEPTNPELVTHAHVVGCLQLTDHEIDTVTKIQLLAEAAKTAADAHEAVVEIEIPPDAPASVAQQRPPE